MRVGVDIGGTKIEAVAIDQHLDVIARVRTPVRRGATGVIAGTLDAIAEIAGQAGGPASSLGIGIPGVIRGGVVRHARNLGIDSLDLSTIIGDATGLRVRVCNDVNAAALGAWTLRGAGSRAFAYLNLGTGLAAGFVLDGRLWEGADGLAGEIGYISIDPHGPCHVDGLAGVLETYASGSGVAAQWGVDGAAAVDVFEAATAGDERAMAIREGVYFGAAQAVRVLALTFGADPIVIGGGLTMLGAALQEGINRHFQRWAETSPLIASLRLDSVATIHDDDRPLHAVGAAIVGERPNEGV